MTKEQYNCDNVSCNHNNTKGLCCLFNPDNCKYRQLQKENANLKDVIEGYKKIAKWCDNCDKISELQKEIRCECTRCVYSDSPCIRSDYGVENDEDVCPNYENVFAAYTQIKEENAELKVSCKIQVDTAFQMIYEKDEQLTKAKFLLKQLVDAFPKSYSDVVKDTLDEARKFVEE